MANKKSESETLRQRRIANKEFIELKKMQRGEIQPENKSSESEKIMTTSDKLKNFWYYYGKIVIIGIVIFIGIVFCVRQCMNKPKYDLKIIYFTYEQVPDSVTEKLEKDFKKLGSDTNGDGEIIISVINCSCNPEARATEILTKLQALIAADEQAVLFITDDDSMEYFNNIKTDTNSFFSDESAILPQEFFNETVYTPTKTFKVSVRNMTKSNMKDKSVRYIKTAKKIVEKLNKRNGQ